MSFEGQTKILWDACKNYSRRRTMDTSMEQTKDDAWGVNVVERIRVRIMTEAYDLTDRGDLEGYNGIKLMCHEVLRIIEAHMEEATARIDSAVLSSSKKDTQYLINRYATKRPLTDDEIRQCSYDAEGFMVSRENAMRAVERAHGIGAEE